MAINKGKQTNSFTDKYERASSQFNDHGTVHDYNIEFTLLLADCQHMFDIPPTKYVELEKRVRWLMYCAHHAIEGTDAMVCGTQFTHFQYLNCPIKKRRPTLMLMLRSWSITK